MRTISARDAKNAFGVMIDTALVEPITIGKHGRPVVVVMSVERYRQFCEAELRSSPQRSPGLGSREAKD
jgi:prevent-host-death family protein